MTETTVGRGSTFLVPGTHLNPDKSHLCVVLTSPPADGPPLVLYVPIITFHEKYDATCILGVGDHEFIKEKSCVHYATAAVRTVKHLKMCGIPKQSLESKVTTPCM